MTLSFCFFVFVFLAFPSFSVAHDPLKTGLRPTFGRDPPVENHCSSLLLVLRQVLFK